MASPANLTIERLNSSKTGLVSSVSSQRSYGTVKDASHSPTVSSRSVHAGFLTHEVREADTLQGLAVKYGVTVHLIRRHNNLWDSESIQSRTQLKIPGAFHSLDSSPIMSRTGESQSRANHERLSSSLEHYSTSSTFSGGDDGPAGTVASNGREVVRTGSPSVSGSEVSSEQWSSELSDEVKLKPVHLLVGKGSCGSFGEKTIDGILGSADEQLIEARKFAEKLAKRSAALQKPPDSYNRTDKHVPDTSNLKEKTFKHRRRRAKQTSESVSESREKVEDDLFEL